VNVAALADVVRATGPAEAAGLLDALGIGSVSSVRFRAGFDGPALRQRWDVRLTSRRQGVARLFGGAEFSLADLPKLPADLAAFRAGHLDLKALYEAVAQTLESLDRPGQPNARASLAQIDKVLGLSLRDDLLAALGSRYVFCSS